MFFKLGTGSAVKERITLLNQSSYLSQVKKTEYSTKVCFQTVTLEEKHRKFRLFRVGPSRRMILNYVGHGNVFHNLLKNIMIFRFILYSEAPHLIKSTTGANFQEVPAGGQSSSLWLLSGSIAPCQQRRSLILVSL